MLIRLLVFIFALNVIAPPAVAKACDMMNDMEMTSTSQMMSAEMINHVMSDVKMDCCMDHDQSCNTSQCVGSTTSHFQIFSIDATKNFVIDILSKRPKDNLLSLYEIFLPINTPPPLV